MTTWKVVVLLFLQFLAGIIILIVLFSHQALKELNNKIDQIKKDIVYKEKQWDLSKYNTDPVLIGSFPLYLITTDGFILDRRSPIHGFLDISDMKLLLKYKTPQTDTAFTGQKRRVYTQPIMSNKQIAGIIAVSYFNPQEDQTEFIDMKLKTVITDIMKDISVQNTTINTNKIDERRIPYDVAFSVIDRYNTVIKKTTNVNNFKRIPNFIDPSYIKNYVEKPSIQISQDIQTHHIFLISSKPLLDKNNLPLGTIILGDDITNVIHLLRTFVIFQFVLTIIFFAFGLYGKNSYQNMKSNLHLSVSFNERKGMLVVNNHVISIPYATNQFYLLQALFGKPTKRWETDELLKRFGEDEKTNNSRKVYDTMVKINNKVHQFTSIKLITLQNKTYQLNSDIKISA